MRKTRLAIGALLPIAILSSLPATLYGDAWMRLTPQVQCQNVSIAPSMVLEGFSIIMVTGSGCTVPYSKVPATVIVWTPFGHSLFGYEANNTALLSGGAPLMNGSFVVLLGNYGAYAGDWDVNVQIWQNNQIVNQGSAGVLTVIKATPATCGT
jgi:hypothetical protein